MRRSPSLISEALPTNCSAIRHRLFLTAARPCSKLRAATRAACRAASALTTPPSILQIRPKVTSGRAAATAAIPLLPPFESWTPCSIGLSLAAARGGGTDDRRFPAPLHAARAAENANPPGLRPAPPGRKSPPTPEPPPVP